MRKTQPKRRRLAAMFVAAACALPMGAGCSAPLVPAPREPRISREEAPNAQVIEALRRDWKLLQSPNLPQGERAQAMERYNNLLLLLLRRYRVDVLCQMKCGNPDYMPPGIGVVREADGPGLPLREVYDDMVPAADVLTRSLEDHYVVPGLGVPLVGIIPAAKVDKAGKRNTIFNIHARGTVRTLTAVLEFPGKGKARLRFIPRHRQEYVRVGRMVYPLAGDFSAPIELYWNLTRVKEGRFLGLLRPQELRDVTGLSCIEGYSPEKIPVILTHGLMSSAGTFDNLVNRLVSDPEIRRRYQFWYFNYPTGVAWTVSAAAYRKALQDVRRQVDPKRRNKNWDKMVVVGHSMGGLITRYSQCEQPWLMLKDLPKLRGRIDPYLSARYVDTALPIPQYDRLRQDYFFRPVKAGMVVYMATPHQGAPMARYRLASSLMQLVRLPENLVGEVLGIVTLQQDAVLFNPKQVTEWFTSVNQLSPDSYSIRGLRGLKVRRVPTHSIIGDRGRGNSPRSSDGVVPYWSSHLGWGSETIVPSDHSVQDVPETAEDLKKVLKGYLERK